MQKVAKQRWRQRLASSNTIVSDDKRKP